MMIFGYLLLVLDHWWHYWIALRAACSIDENTGCGQLEGVNVFVVCTV